MRQKRLLSVIGAFMGVVIALPYVVVWARGEVFGTFDLSHITIAIEDLYARYQAAGEVPVWTPEFQGGFPMMANGFQSFFYPPHVLLRSFLPGVWVANISLLLHAWLAAAGMWLLLRAAKLSPIAAAVGSLLFSGGGYFVGHVTLPHLFFPAAWLPLILWQLLSFWQRPAGRHVVWCAALIAVQVFAGHVQMFVYTALMLALASAVLLAQKRIDRRLSWIMLVPPLVFVLTAVHVLPIQELLPLSKRGEAVVGEESFSVSYPPWQALTWVQADIFGTQGTYVGAKNEPELLLFFGLTGVVLGIWGIGVVLTRRTPLPRIAVLLVVAGFALGLGEYSVIYRWLHSLPTFLAGLANPGRAMILAHLGVSILAGLGMDDLLRRTRRMAAAWAALAIGLTAAIGYGFWQQLPLAVAAVARHQFAWTWLVVISIVFLITLFLPQPIRKWALLALVSFEVTRTAIGVNPSQSPAALTVPVRLAPALADRGPAPRIFAHTRLEPVPVESSNATLGPRLDATRSIQQTVVPARNGWRGVRVWLTWGDERRQPVTVRLIITGSDGQMSAQASVAGEELRADEPIDVLFSSPINAAGRPHTVTISSTASGPPQPHVLMYPNIEGDFDPTGELAHCIRGTCEKVAVPQAAAAADAAETLLYDDASLIPEREALTPLFGESFGYPMVRGHMQMQLLAMHEYLYELGEQADFLPDRLLLQRQLLDRLSVGWLVALWPEHRFLTGMPNVSLVESEPAGDRYARLYRNEQAWPRVHTVTHIQLARSVDDARRQLVENQVAPDAVVVVASTLPSDIGTSPARITVRHDEAQSLRVAVASGSTQLLVVRDAAFPGWQAFVDVASAPILTVDSLWRGVVVPAGEHEVTFTYQPTPYRIGAAVSGVSWLLILALAAYAIRYPLPARS